MSRVDALTDEVRVIAAGLRAIEERVANQVTLFGEQLQRFAAVNTAHEQAEKRSEEIATRLKELIGLMSRPKRGRRKAS